jgi:hypothetical protein
MAKLINGNQIQIEENDQLGKLYGSNWKALSGYTGDPTKLQIGTILPAPASMLAGSSAGTSNDTDIMAKINALKSDIAGKEIDLANANYAGYSGSEQIPQSLLDMNVLINSHQPGDIASGGNAGDPTVKKSTSEIDKLLSGMGGDATANSTGGGYADIIKALTPTTDKPVAPDLTGEYNTLKTQYGIGDLETELNGLKTEAAAIKATRTTRTNAERGKTVATNVIEGRVSQVERQENERLTAITDQINSVADRLTTKYNVVKTLMDLTQQDYTNASSSYNSQLTQNINMYNILKGLTDDQKTTEQKAQDDARSNLQIIYNQLTSGGLTTADLTPDQKTLITKLEVQSGLPVGFYSNMQNKNPKADNVATIDWTDENNNKYVSIITRDAKTGKLVTENQLIGKAKATGSTSEQKAEEMELNRQQIMADVGGITGEDTKVDPNRMKELRQDIALNNPELLSWFDNAYKPADFLNPTYYPRAVRENKWLDK